MVFTVDFYISGTTCMDNMCCLDSKPGRFDCFQEHANNPFWLDRDGALLHLTTSRLLSTLKSSKRLNLQDS